jgi:NAD(P)-dependent dehydrogenase (short-subunit alcohol dehydrogenase family)
MTDEHFGDVALITGATKGIGYGIALALADAGYAVGLCARSEEVEAVAQQFRDRGANAYGWRADMADTAAVHRFVDGATDHFGHVDVLVNNAGLNRASPIMDVDPDDIDAMFETNVRGAFVAVQAAGRHMIGQGGGRIVNIASFVAQSPAPGFVAYSATKAALLALTRGAALELSDSGVTVNAVSPGNVWTEIWESSTADTPLREARTARELFDETVATQPIKRGVTPEEVAHAVLFLCSNRAGSITGENIVVASGL